MKAYTSRSRFDEKRNFTGVFQQMGRVSLDADWNEDVLIRVNDARRRTHDLAHGSPDDGFYISDEHLIDGIHGLEGWSGTGLVPGDLRVIPPSIRLDRRHPESLPHVVRCHGHVSISRVFDTPRDLAAIPLRPAGSFAATALIFSIKFARPANDDDPTAVEFFITDADNNTAAVAAAFGAELPGAWAHQRIAVTAFAGVDLHRIAQWGVRGLPPRADTWIDALRAVDKDLSPTPGGDFVIRGGDGTVAGAGRMLVNGVRTYIERDVRYSRQPDLPDPPALAALDAGGSDAHLVYLDTWEQLVTALDDPYLDEPALDGLDTTVRLQLLSQIKVRQNVAAGQAVDLPPATGGGRLTTNVPAGALPDRYPPDPVDPCRDRCLSSENASLGQGYTGAHNIHFRIEIVHVDQLDGHAISQPVIVWSRDNGSTRLALTASVPADATTLSVSSEDALALRAGDVIEVSDQRIDRQPDGNRAAVMRVVKDVDPATGTIYLEQAGYNLTTAPAALPAGGPLGQAFTIEDRAYIRRWDGADWLLDNVRYNLPDGITFRFAGTGWRRRDYWSLTARVENADGAARGVVETLNDAPVHGPVHHCVPLARITRTGDTLHFEDLRPRFLPLNQVRDRLAELVADPVPTGAFTLIIGDGVRTFGDIDQDLAEGVTGDEALQSAVNKLSGAGGGSIYVRAGDYRLEKPVLLSACSRLRIIGDGDASALRVVGAGGAFIIDGCGTDGGVGIEQLSLVEAPLEDSVIGEDAEELPPPGEEVDPLDPADLIQPSSSSPNFAETVAASITAAAYRTRRAFNAVLSTLEELRRLQHQNPGQPVEDLPAAAKFLALLRALPHGVVTIADSNNITLASVRVESRETRPEAGGVLLTGSCTEVRVAQCRILAPAGVVAMPYGPYLARAFLAKNPRSGVDIQGLRIEGNHIKSAGDAGHGVYLADGVLRNVRVRDNTFHGFAIGIAIRDRIDLDKRRQTGVSIAGNRLEGCTGMGIDVVGRGVDVVDNAIENAAATGLFQAGIRVRGNHLRVRGCEIVLPPSLSGLANSPLGLVAGIIVGAGVDHGIAPGYQTMSPVHDVDIGNCQIRAHGATYPGIGVVIGGPQPSLDIRIRDCNFHDLGDAAVRVWGHGGKVGRIRVDDNRIEGVALANIPATADSAAAVAELAPSVAADLSAAGVDFTDPGALLRALVDASSDAVLGPLDGVLRWVSLRTLRGAIIFDHVLEGEIVSNRIHGVGADTATQGDDVRTTAISAISGNDVVIEGNLVEHVVARRQTLTPPAEPAEPARPAAYSVLKGLDLAVSDDHAERVDVHAAAVALRRMILAYGGGDDAERMRLGRRVYTAMDALIEDLDAFGGSGAKIAASLVLEADEMRTAQGRDDHTRASNRVRATLSRAAAFTADADQAQEAWEAATQFDLAVVNDKVEATATRLQDAAAELAKGLPERKSAIETVMGRVLAAPANLAAQLAAAAELGTLGQWRDAAASRARMPERVEIFGSRQTIVKRFAEQIDSEAGRLATDSDADNRATLEALRPDKDALIDTLRPSNAELADALEIDWRALERSVSQDKKDRLQSTLARIKDFTEGGSGRIHDDATAASRDVERLADAGNASLVGLVARHLDGNVAKLVLEPEGMKTKSLKVLQSAAGQLRSLVSDDAEATDLATKASAAIRTAAEDIQKRTSELAKARTYLGAIRRRVEPRTPGRIPGSRQPEKKKSLDKLDIRLAALGTVVLAVRDLTGTLRTEGLALFRAHFERALDLAGYAGRVHASAMKTVDDAAAVLNQNGPASEQDRALHTLMKQLDRVTGALTSQNPPASLAAAAVLIRAAMLGLDAAEDEPSRLLRVQAYLRERSASLSQSVHHSLAQRSSLSSLLHGIHGVMERLAMGERPMVPEPATPFFPQKLSPADGIFAAGLSGRLRLVANQVQHAVRGMTLVGSTGHPLVGAAPEDDGLVLQVAGNRIDGCALGGLDLRPTGTISLSLTNNEIFASAGIAEPGLEGIGQSVVHIQGTGDLVIQGNVLQGNGHRHDNALLHELVVDWRGESVIRGNTIRHIGGGAGGAGLLLVAEAVTTGLAKKLATAPFLGIEPPPKPGPANGESKAPSLPSLPVLPVLATAMRSLPRVDTASDRLTTGRLVQRISTTRIAPRLLTVARPTRVTSLAATNAARYLDRTLVSPMGSILDFVRPGPYRKPVPPAPPPEQRTLHVEGNDVAAYGPALLLVADQEGDLISTSIVGNGLHSEGGTGAAYVRYAESVVFATNRCQAPDAVNVVVIRALAAAVSVTGNVIAGKEPVAPPPPPPKPAKPRLPGGPGQITLNLPIGENGALSVPIDPAKLRGSIESFSGEAQKAFANVLVERAAEEEPFLSEIEIREIPTAPAEAEAATTEAATTLERTITATESGTTGTTGTTARLAPRITTIGASAPLSFGAILSTGATKYAISRFEGPQEPDTVIKYIEDQTLSSRDVEALMRGTELREFADDDSRQAFIDKLDLYRKTKKLEEIQAKTAVDTAVERAEAASVFKRVATTGQTQAKALATMSKLFTAQGFTADRTTAEVQTLLQKSEGDAIKALDTLQKDIFASDQAAPSARKAIEDISLVEKVLAEGLFTGRDAIAEPEEEESEQETSEPAPDAHAHSLVIVGGATVAVVGNATSAGTLVQDAQESVELNV